MDKNFLTIEQTAQYLELPIATIYQFTHKRIIPYSRPTGRRLYFFKSDLDAFVMRNYHKSRLQIENEVTV